MYEPEIKIPDVFAKLAFVNCEVPEPVKFCKSMIDDDPPAKYANGELVKVMLVVTTGEVPEPRIWKGREIDADPTADPLEVKSNPMV